MKRTARASEAGLSASTRHKVHEAQRQTVHRQELDQLSTFIQKRTQLLDDEISDLRGKVGATTRGKEALAASGVQMQSQRSASVENDSLERVTEHADLRLSGKAMGKVQLQPNRIVQESKRAAPKLEKSSQRIENVKYQKPPDADQLVTFLAKLKLKVEDAGLSYTDLMELLLATDLAIPGETWLPIDELTNVLQTDVLLPMTKPDQRLLVEEYGDSSGHIDVRALLLDAGLWDEAFGLTLSANPGSPGYFRPPSPMAESLPLAGDGLLPPPLKGDRRPPLARNGVGVSLGAGGEQAVDMREPVGFQTFREKRVLADSRQVVEETTRNLRDLHNLHDLVMEDADFDEYDGRSAKDKSIADRSSAPQLGIATPLSPVRADPRATINVSNSNTVRGQQMGSTSNVSSPVREHGPRAERSGTEAQDYESNRIRELAAENQKLKDEIKNFDGEFFEQLEDLKYRYSTLQEVLGEDPLLRATVSARLKDGPMPLNKLAWSVRKSMTAIDRASYDSPLVQGPRSANAYTYAPGLQSDYIPESELGHLGGTLSANQADRQNFIFDIMGRGPGKNAVPGLSTARVGGRHGIGAGTNMLNGDNEQGGSFANLCERRLAFELSNLPKPDDAILTLLNRVLETGDRNRAEIVKKGNPIPSQRFITVPQLQACFRMAAIEFSQQEIHVLASGFASDGKGGINCDEFCNMVQSIAYNLLGHYSRSYQSDSRATQRTSTTNFRRRKGAEEYAEEEDLTNSKTFQQVLGELCDAIITFDKRSVLGASSNFNQTLLKPFVEIDLKGKGWIHFYEFKQVLRELGAMLSPEEYSVLARPFLLLDERAEAAYPTSNLNHIQSFRDAKLTGSLTGHGKATSGSSARFADFLASHGLEGTISKQQSDQVELGDDSMVDYVEFVEVLSRMMGKLVDEKGGLPIIPKLPWIMKEFDFIDVLLSQLESMKSTSRRKTLITLQYALENADSREAGELDGFAILTALINCGFRLQRFERVQLLRAAEEYGGVLDYSRLVLVLLQTTIDWTQSERDIVLKILRAMGVTVEQRRNWLARLKKELLERTTQQKMKLRAMEQTTPGASLRDSYQSVPQDTGDRSYDIPPAVFLHVLRDLHVELSPEEEAVLLDCLDTERIAKLQAKKLHGQLVSAKSKNKTLWNGTSNNPSQTGGEFALPSVDYQSFITYCARHCGSWIDSNPKLYDAIYSNIKCIHYPLQALQEFSMLCKSFDELGTGYISHRAFLICCNRATLFAQVNEENINELATNLSIEGAGEIEYKVFSLQLRGICASVQQENGKHSTIHSSGLTIIQQLIKNASDNQNPNVSSMLLPLRKWLMLHSDTGSLILTLKEFNALLREFSVIYRPEDLDLLFMEIGYDLDRQESLSALSSRSKTNSARFIASGWDSELATPSDSQSRVRVVSTRKLLQVLNSHRESWVDRHPTLARQLIKALKAMPVDGAGKDSKGSLPTAHGDSHVALALLKVISRMEAFAVSLQHLEGGDDNDVAANYSQAGKTTRTTLANMGNLENSAKNLLAKHPLDATQQQQQQKLIEMDVFDYLLRSMGVHMQKTDLLFLADASDPHPEANYINIYLLFEIIRRESGTSAQELSLQADGGLSAEMEEEYHVLTDAARYALDHMQALTWKAMSQTTSLKPAASQAKAGSKSSSASVAIMLNSAFTPGRTALEWINDVKCVFQGFDAYGNGLISLQDFVLALHCLNIKMSLDLIRDITPYVGPTASGPVQYKKILSYVLSTSPYTQNKTHPAEAGASPMPVDGKSVNLRDAQKTKGGAPKTRETRTANEAVSKLLHVVRRNICIKQLILSNQHLEEAWMDLLRVFHTFDQNETNRVSARDFCLAVAVLLNTKSSETDSKRRSLSSDDIVLSRAEWEQIIEYFTVNPTQSSTSKQATNNRGELLLVDYMLFCELVLDPKEVTARLKELQFNPDIRQMRMDYAKDNVLSKKPHAPTLQVDGRSTSAGPKRSTSREDAARSSSAALNKKFNSYEGDSSTSGAIATRGAGKGRGKDDITERFDKAQERYRGGVAFGRNYGAESERGANSAGYSHRGGITEPVDDLSGTRLRAGHTTGQSSRDHAHARAASAAGLSKTSAAGGARPLSNYSSQDLYNSSHKTQRVKFNWTVS